MLFTVIMLLNQHFLFWAMEEYQGKRERSFNGRDGSSDVRWVRDHLCELREKYGRHSSIAVIDQKVIGSDEDIFELEKKLRKENPTTYYLLAELDDPLLEFDVKEIVIDVFDG